MALTEVTHEIPSVIDCVKVQDGFTHKCGTLAEAMISKSLGLSNGSLGDPPVTTSSWKPKSNVPGKQLKWQGIKVKRFITPNVKIVRVPSDIVLEE